MDFRPLRCVVKEASFPPFLTTALSLAIFSGRVQKKIASVGILRVQQHPPREKRLTNNTGRAIAQAVSSWLPTAAARVQTRVWYCGIL
jgi:hypothetical protein